MTGGVRIFQQEKFMNYIFGPSVYVMLWKCWYDVHDVNMSNSSTIFFGI